MDSWCFINLGCTTGYLLLWKHLPPFSVCGRRNPLHNLGWVKIPCHEEETQKAR
jgi:hypothetical protein